MWLGLDNAGATVVVRRNGTKHLTVPFCGGSGVMTCRNGVAALRG